MNDAIRDLVIVGGGLAGAKAAETARGEGFDGSVTIVGAEPHRPYERPPLSKAFLVGEMPEQDVYVHPAQDYDDLDITLHLDDPVVAIDRDRQTVVTGGGRRLAYDRLLLATGASARRLPIGDGDLDGILTLRTLDDSRRLAELLRSANHVTVVGAGWIGCEVAAAARTLGVEVTIADPLDVPLRRVLGERIGGVFRDLHADHGVDLRLGVGVSGASGASRVEQIGLTDGTTIDTDLVVVGIGAVPRTELAADAGLEIDDGIVVDQTLSTSDPAILAAGDVARAWHPTLGMYLRVEHWANALNQGQTAGRNLIGAGQSYDRLPYFYSDQYDLGMEYVGHAPDPDRVVIRGDTTTRQFIAFWLGDHDRIAAAMNVNTWDVIDDLKTVIRVSVVIPARNEQATIAAIVRCIRDRLMHRERLVDELIVVDSHSRDDTACVAEHNGATVVSQTADPNGGDGGKGHAMRQGLDVSTGDLIVFVDADIRDFDERFVVGLLGPLLTQPDLALVKATYRRPLVIDGTAHPDAGGRVTELMARPLLSRYWPDLADLGQPLAGEYAAPRRVLDTVGLTPGFGVDLALLLDVATRFSSAAIGQVDMGKRTHTNKALVALVPMAEQILSIATRRLTAVHTDGPCSGHLDPVPVR